MMSKISVCFFVLVLLEIFLCGSGQTFIIYKGLTLKMLNFGLMCLFGLFYLFDKKKLRKDILFILISFSALLLLAFLEGAFGVGNNIFLDISPLLYMFSIVYFYYFIRGSETAICIIVKVLKISGLVLASFYLLYIILLKTEVLTMEIVLLYLSDESDFIFRGVNGIFFYKGFIFLPITLAFYVCDNKLLKWQNIILLAAIFYSQTRGFYVMAVFDYLFYFTYVLYKSKYCVSRKKTVTVLAIFVVLVCVLVNNNTVLVGQDRTESDSVRFETFFQVVDSITPWSFWFGHGFGYGVPIRPIHMEVAYLEIFHKQGIVGLLFWFALLLQSILLFFRTAHSNKKHSLPFLISILVIYIQSLFNPFINNPIGLSFIILSYLCISYCNENKCLCRDL